MASKRTPDPTRSPGAAGWPGYAAGHSAALLLFPRPHQVDVGSSTCVRIAERFLLATAGHNIEDLEHDGQIKVIDPGGGELTLVGRNSRRFQGSATVDIAWIELHPEAAKRSRLRFLHVSQLARGGTDDREAPFYVQGFPSAMVAVGADLEADLDPCPLGFLTRTIDPSSRGERHQQGVDLAVEYASHGDGQRTSELPRPSGLSGGGMWRVERATGSAGARLVAITRTWHSGKRELCGTAIEHWLQLVYVDFPDLRSCLEPVLLAEHESEDPCY